MKNKFILGIFIMLLSFTGFGQVYNHNTQVKLKKVNELANQNPDAQILARDGASGNRIRYIELVDMAEPMGAVRGISGDIVARDAWLIDALNYATLKLWEDTLGNFHYYDDVNSIWVQFSAGGGGSNIYTADGTLTGNRLVTIPAGIELVIEAGGAEFYMASGEMAFDGDFAIADQNGNGMNSAGGVNEITATQGLTVRPGTGGVFDVVAIGDVLTATDTGGGTKWQTPVSSALQATTVAGNTTDQGIVMTMGEGTELVLLDAISSNIKNTLDQSGINLTNTDVVNEKAFRFQSSGGIPNQIVSIGSQLTSTGFTTSLIFPDNTSNETITLPTGKTGIVALISDITGGNPEGYNVVGTAPTSDLVITLGDINGDNNATTFVVDDAAGRIYTDISIEMNGAAIRGGGGFLTTISKNGNATANRDIYVQDKSGIMALLDDLDETVVTSSTISSISYNETDYLRQFSVYTPTVNGNFTMLTDVLTPNWPVGAKGKVLFNGTGTCNFTPFSGAVTIVQAAGFLLNPGEVATVVKIAADTWSVSK